MGSGIAGNAAAYMLRDHFEVVLEEFSSKDMKIEICLSLVLKNTQEVVVEVVCCDIVLNCS